MPNVLKRFKRLRASRGLAMRTAPDNLGPKLSRIDGFLIDGRILQGWLVALVAEDGWIDV